MSASPKRIISEANDFLSTDNNRQLIYYFLEKYSQCEVYIRPFLMQYYKSIGEQIKQEEIGMEAKTIRIALSENGIIFADKKLITRIFGSEDRSGKSSCRWLRNKISHELMRRALKEVCERNTELLSDLDSFLCEISFQA